MGVMKKFFKLFLILLFVLLTAPICFAQDNNKVLILPDNLQFESTNYLVYPDASVIFASDVINDLKIGGKVDIVSMREVRDAFRKSVKTQLLAKNILKEYKYNYNVSFVDLKTLTKTFSTNKVLLITSTTDVQNYVLRRTVWDFLNIAGATVIDPAYKLSTYVALVDVDKEEVLWQQTYHKSINSQENRIVAVNFAPATEQLEHIKFYSENFLSPMIAGIIQSKLAPTTVTAVQGTVMPAESDIEQINFLHENEIKTKSFVPTRPKLRTNGSMVNDL